LLLFDLNVIYALRFWAYLEHTALLVRQKGQAPAPQSHELRELDSTPELLNDFYDMRNNKPLVPNCFRPN